MAKTLRKPEKLSPCVLSAESRFKRMVEGLRQEYFFYCHGTDGDFYYISPSITNILGYTQAEFLKHFDKYLTPNPANKEVLRHTALSINGRRQPPYEVEIYHKNGSVRTLEVLEIPVRHKGKVVAVEGIAKDITEEKRTQALLREYGREMAAQTTLILQSSGEGIVGVDPAGLVTFANDSACRMLGWKPGELTGKPLHETVHGRRPDGTPYPACECPMRQALAAGKECRSEKETLWRRDGTGFPASYSVRPIAKAGKIAGAVVTFNDITERKRLEQLKDFLVHSIVHDLNTPLAVIMAGAELASDCPGGLPGCNNREHLSTVFEMANEMKKMLSDMLDISRMEEGVMRLNRAPARPAALVDSAAAALAPLAKLNSRALERAVPAGLPEVSADFHVVNRVLENLASNALRYAPQGSAVKLSAAACAAGKEVVFSVSDGGRGILPEHLDKVFEKFFQSEQLAPRGRQGKGLGLTFCRMAVEAHGGRIWAENLKEGGCRFSFTLPAAGRGRAGRAGR